jgi:hypothetical protein
MRLPSHGIQRYGALAAGFADVHFPPTAPGSDRPSRVPGGCDAI